MAHFIRTPVSVTRKFFQLSASRRRALLSACVVVPVVQIALKLLPFARVMSIVNDTKTTRADGIGAEDIAWAVTAVGSRIRLRGPCLTLAIATSRMFRRRGYPVDLQIGVAKLETGEIKAHAWIEKDGQVLVGKLDDLSEYTPLPSINRSNQ